MLSASLSVGCPAAASTAATSSGVRPTPSTLLSLGTSIPPSRSAMAGSSPMLNVLTFAGAGAGAGAASATGAAAASGGGASSFLEQATSRVATAKAANRNMGALRILTKPDLG